MHVNHSTPMRLEALEKIASHGVMCAENDQASSAVLAGLDAHARIPPANASIR